MALTEIEELLMEGLMLFPITKGNLVLTMMMTDTEEKQRALIDYLAAHREATSEQVLKEAHRIVETYPPAEEDETEEG